ncbi:MAG: hypothetical protein ACHQAV_02145 [Solirubrobacterales bacterium]
MAKSNDWDGYCDVCRRPVRAGEGIKTPDSDARRGYLILCVEHAPEGSLNRPRPPEAAKLSSIYLDDDKYER